MTDINFSSGKNTHKFLCDFLRAIANCPSVPSFFLHREGMTESSNIQWDLGAYRGCTGEFDLEPLETTSPQDLSLFLLSDLSYLASKAPTLPYDLVYLIFPFLSILSCSISTFFSSLSLVNMTIFLSVSPVFVLLQMKACFESYSVPPGKSQQT